MIQQIVKSTAKQLHILQCGQLGGAMKTILCVTFVLFSVFSVQAAPTGNDVLSSCQTAVRFAEDGGAPTKEHFDAGWCLGWLVPLWR